MSIISGVMHYALRVKDLETSHRFYSDVLGFEEMFRLNKPNGDLWLLYMRITDTTYLELFPNADEDSTIIDFERGAGVNHLCLTVESMDAFRAHLEGAGVEVLEYLPKGLDRNVILWFADPDGNRIEVMEMAVDSMQYEAIARIKQAQRG